MALLVDPTDSTTANPTVNEVLAAARAFGLQLHVLHASSEHDFEGVFAKLSQLGAGGLVVAGGPFFASHGEQLAAIALRHAVPVAYQRREFTAAGGLLSYGSDLTESYRLAGIYAGRILKGDKPADLPVQQATKVELYINLKTAKTFGITVPLTLSGRADEVIE
jgi:putative tryptophan/tyrosine transport system substrate-binding protein